MLLLSAKILEVRELPANEPFPASCLVSVLAGTQTLNLVGRHELLSVLEALDPFTDVQFEIRWKQIDLASLGGSGKGKAYRLSIASVKGAERTR